MAEEGVFSPCSNISYADPMGEAIKEWTDIVVAVAAIAALFVSLVSLRLSSRALRLSEKQEERREPKLVPRLVDSHFEDLASGDRIYSCLLSVGNPADSDNAVAQIEMHLRYFIDGFTLATVKLPSAGDQRNTKLSRLIAPTRIAAHDTVSGWCSFLVKSAILNGRAVEGYRIVITDSHQGEATVEPLVISEKRDAV